ncbi:hypothetical protein LDBPK_331620 [Leishmania donovani]|uniref:Uncharacterized protein n=1 Tax=Leishmania donovani TaxID=5661 RepID=E9BQ93_LEIDO|nr:hypothetical protein LDBPK_331620 [Leishmania donovani]AYU82140.1 hypothetical protein LdCL_330022800 [Leishmania donovani]CBZ37305.1 hypothetical protein LDBPK_331620 [Leishmania donovani]
MIPRHTNTEACAHARACNSIAQCPHSLYQCLFGLHIICSLDEGTREARTSVTVNRFVFLCSDCISIRVVASLGVYACFSVGVIQAVAYARNFPSFLAHLCGFSARSTSRVTLSGCLITDALILPPLLHHSHLLHCEHKSVSRALRSARDDALIFFFTLALTACSEGGIAEPQTRTHTHALLDADEGERSRSGASARSC